MKVKKIALLVFALLLLGALPLFIQGQQTRSSAHTSVNSDDDTWTMTHRDNGRELRIRVRGKADFNDDYSEVTGLSRGGSFRVEETNGGVSRRLEIEMDANGSQQRAYFVQGKAHAFDNDARQWLAGLLVEAVRQSGYDAPRRVARLYQKGGANAVLEEVALIRGDYAKRVYLRELLANHQLDSASVQRVVQLAARQFSSAYEKRQVLMLVAEKYLDDTQTLTEFIAAIATIDSDYERGQTLSAALKHGSLTSEQLQGVLQAVAHIGSDYEKAQVLLRIANSQQIGGSAQDAFFAATNTIRSDYEHSRVLLSLLNSKPSAEALKQTLKSVASISSDYEKARVLLQVASLGRNDEEIRKALVEAARNIGSDYERGRVLSATFK